MVIYDIMRGIGRRGIPPWGMFSFAVWTHSQGAVAALVSLMKPDVKEAVVDFVRCRWQVKNATAPCTESMGAMDNSQTNTNFKIRQTRLEDALQISLPMGASLRRIPWRIKNQSRNL